MKYYDGSKLMSYNALFSFSVGARGSGKTFWFKEYAIRDFIKNGNQFAYVRRYRDEIKFAKQTFTDDLVAAGKFEGHEFKTQGNFLMVDGKQAGLFVYLSSNVKLKSSSYPLIDKICLDEFIIDKDSHYRYLPNDVEAFLNVYETIARMRDVRAIFLSNAYTISNPYFTFFDIYPSKSGYIFKNDIVLETVSNDEFVEAKTQTRFGKIIRGSQFEKSAVFNHFILDNPELIQKRPSNASLLFNVFYKNKYYGIWLEKNKTQFYISYDHNQEAYTHYLTKDNLEPSLLAIKHTKSAGGFKIFIDAVYLDCCRFESQKIKNESIQWLRLFLK